MRVVIYAEDMEPITVIELAPWAYERLSRGDRVNLVAMEPLPITFNPNEQAAATMRYITIYAELLQRRGVRHMMVFTGNDETALLLKSAFLPGQHRRVDEVRKKALVEGFMKAINALGHD